jgi:hypothetical protein
VRTEILSGRVTRERKLAIATAGGSLAPEVRAELLTVLAADSDEAIAQRAQNSLLSIPPEAFAQALGREDAAPQLFAHCAEHLADKPSVADALAQNKSCPAELLPHVARHFTPAAIQLVLDDLERLSAAPDLATALLAHPSLSLEQKRLLESVLEDSGVDTAVMAEAVAEAVPDVKKRESLLQRLNKMRVVERIALALKGNREERMALIRDRNKLVQRAVIQSPRITDADIESYSAMATLTDEILRLIASNRQFIKNYGVVRNLVNNPKTPLDVSLGLMKRLNITDIKRLTMNKNVPETLRTLASKMVRQQKQAGGG